MVQVGSLSAWVTIGSDEVVAQEYNVESVPNTSTNVKERDAEIMTCWIASRAGEKFGVNWKDRTGGSRLAVDLVGIIHLDGVRCRGSHAHKGSKTSEVYHRSTARTSRSTVKEFMFSQIQLTDDEEALGSTSHQSIGDIILEIWAGKISKVYGGSQKYHSIPDCDDKIHERSKKGGAHRVKFREADARESGKSICDLTRLSLRHRIIFKYRSLDILRANSIAPPAPVIAAEPELLARAPKPPLPLNKAELVAEREKLNARLTAIDDTLGSDSPAFNKTNALASGSRSRQVKTKLGTQKPIISLGFFDLTLEEDDQQRKSSKRRREDGTVVKKEKKLKIKAETADTIDLT